VVRPRQRHEPHHRSCRSHRQHRFPRLPRGGRGPADLFHARVHRPAGSPWGAGVFGLFRDSHPGRPGRDVRPAPIRPRRSVPVLPMQLGRPPQDYQGARQHRPAHRHHVHEPDRAGLTRRRPRRRPLPRARYRRRGKRVRGLDRRDRPQRVLRSVHRPWGHVGSGDSDQRQRRELQRIRLGPGGRRGSTIESPPASSRGSDTSP
jgi:hypothetical protein